MGIYKINLIQQLTAILIEFKVIKLISLHIKILY